MGNRPITIGIETDRSSYTAGQQVRGTVYMSITKSNQAAQTLQLQLVGEESAVIHYTTTHTNDDSRHGTHTWHEDHYERSNHIIFNAEYPLAAFSNSQVAVGQYEYPFSIVLPNKLATSMRIYSGESHCEIKYKLRATLIQPGAQNIFFKYPHGTKQIQISASKPKPIGEIPLEMPPEVVPVTTCCCSNKGTMELEAHLNKSILSPNDTIGVRYRCQNHSTEQVTHVKVQIEEVIEWRINGHRERKKQILDQKSFDGHLYPELMAKLPRRWNRPLYPAQQFDQMTPFARGQQWHTTDLYLPHDTHDSYQGHAVTVRHVVSIILKSKGCCTTDPDSSTLVNVVRHLQEDYEQGKMPLNSEPPTVEGIATAPPDTLDNPYNNTFSPTAPEDIYDNTQPIAHAQALPPDWHAQTAEVVEIPMAEAMVVEPIDYESREFS